MKRRWVVKSSARAVGGWVDESLLKSGKVSRVVIDQIDHYAANDKYQ